MSSKKYEAWANDPEREGERHVVLEYSSELKSWACDLYDFGPAGRRSTFEWGDTMNEAYLNAVDEWEAEYGPANEQTA